VRRYLAWASIVEDAEHERLEISTHQQKQAVAQRDAADGIVASRLPEAYQWLLVPTQSSPQSEREWKAFRLSGQDPLAVRASKKLKNDELLVAKSDETRNKLSVPPLAGSVLRMHLDRVPLWRRDHVAVKQLAEDFARYVYLPRLAETRVLLDAIGDGVGILNWDPDTFAYADSYDEGSERYRGLRYGHRLSLEDSGTGLIVKPDVASRQIAAEEAARRGQTTTDGGIASPTSGDGAAASTPRDVKPALAPIPVRRFHGSVSLDPARLGRDAGRIADEVVSHLVGQVGADVNVTLEISADVQNGVPEKVVRTVTENCRTLKFKDHGFEES
jgi:hypothetical protein